MGYENRYIKFKAAEEHEKMGTAKASKPFSGLAFSSL
jgi:hypothetical protein